MRRQFFFCVLVTSFYFPIDSGVSSKLDFDGDSENEKIGIVNVETSDGKSPCSSGGCSSNKTEDKIVDGILTDVVVHVKTSVDLSNVKNQTKDVPDVPVIIGYGGSTPKNFNSDSLIYSEPMLVTDQYPTNRRIGSGDFVPSKPYFHPHSEVNRNTNPQSIMTNYNDHFAWYPKGGLSFNPLEFKTFRKPTWNTMQWNRAPHYNQQTTTPGHTTCTCQNSGLKWYPTTPTWSINDQPGSSTWSIRDESGSGIDDKLAQLN